jgi:hypothetical protein
MGVVVHPSARETFTPRELTDAYKQFKERGAQYIRSSENSAFPTIAPPAKLKRAYR